MIPTGQLFQVRLNGEVFGVVIDDEVVVEAAPQAKGVMGKTFKELTAWVGSIGGSIRPCSAPPMVDNSFRPRKGEATEEVPEDRWFGSGGAARRKRRK